jgi:hypothetical protein
MPIPSPVPLATRPDEIAWEWHRRTDCAHWARCLDVAAYCDWQGISCLSCSAYHPGTAVALEIVGPLDVVCPLGCLTRPTPREVSMAADRGTIGAVILLERRIRGRLYVLPGSRRKVRIAREAGISWLKSFTIVQPRCPICSHTLRPRARCHTCGGYLAAQQAGTGYRIISLSRVRRYHAATA